MFLGGYSIHFTTHNFSKFSNGIRFIVDYFISTYKVLGILQRQRKLLKRRLLKWNRS